MKMLRILAVLIVITAILGLQGCAKTWFVDFTTVDNIDNWKMQDWISPYTYILSSNGLYIDGKILTAPFGFDGDFTLSIVFELDTSILSYVNLLELLLTDGSDASYSEYVASLFMHLGNPTLETYSVYSSAPPLGMSSGTTIPGLKRIGLNTYKLEKRGDIVKVYINGTIISDAAETSYSNTWYFPVLNVDATAVGQLVFKSIKVSYSNNMVSLP